MKILAVGNSFSDDTFEYLDEILKRQGEKDNVICSLYIGGCSLDMHYQNVLSGQDAYILKKCYGDRSETPCSIQDALKREKWDYITMQQSSGNSGIPDSYTQLQNVANFIKKQCPNAKLVWNMTWAYENTSTHPHFSFYDNEQLKMYNSIVNAVKSVVIPSTLFEIIAPCGTAIQNARTSWIGDNLTCDGFHMSHDFGRYVVGLCFASSITGKSPDVEFSPYGVDDKRKRVGIESVQNAILSPFEVTQSKLKNENS